MSRSAIQTSSAIMFEAKVILPDGAQSPDDFARSSASLPATSFVVSRHNDGAIASVYSENRWDWSPYCPSGRQRLLSFDTWCQGEPNVAQRAIIDDMRWLMFALIWLREGRPLAYATLTQYMVTLHKLALFVEPDGGMIQGLLNDAVRLTRYLDEMGDYYASVLARLLDALRKLGEQVVGFVVISKKRQRHIDKRYADYRGRMQQTPPIPTRIFCEILKSLSRELEAFEQIATQYLSLTVACAVDPLWGRTRNQQGLLSCQTPGLRKAADGSRWRPVFSELLDDHGLRDYFVSNGLQLSVKGISKGLTRVQFCAALLVHAYSGMRRDEVQGLPFHCDETFDSCGLTHHLIAGYTTKLNHGRKKKARWVTSCEGLRAIRIAQRVATAIYKSKGVRATKARSKDEHLPLFISVSYLGFNGYKMNTDRDRHLPGGIATAWGKDFLTGIVPTIVDEDIEELEHIDPHRCWRSEKAYRLGEPWKLTTHQFRRSLALYASRSGLVSLPTLRRQLQHITEEMSLYYARGSAFANNLIDDQDHFGHVYRNVQPESEALAYIKDLLLSDERLFGAHGARIEQRKRSNASIVTVKDRETTRRKTERGEIAHKETPLGGCAEPGPCNKKAMRSIVGCLNCAGASIKLSKLNRVIAAQQSLVADLDATTVEWRTENGDLEVMIAARNKFIEQGN
jgi:hypothetical protein